MLGRVVGGGDSHQKNLRFSFMPLMDLAAHIGGLLMGTGQEIPLASYFAENSGGS